MQSACTRLSVVLLIAALAVVVPAPETAGAEPDLVLEEVPYPMDSTNQAGWWNPIAEHAGATYFAFDAPAPAENQHEIHIAKRSASGQWSVGCLQAPDGGCVRYNDDIGHHQPSIAVDGNGRLHAFVSMHGSRWRYYRSDEPGSVTLTDHSAEMPDQDAGITYPTTTSTRTGDVYVIVRATSTETGGYGSGRMYRWDVDTGTWSRVAIFAHENGFSVYPDQLRSDPRGQVHVLWEWAGGSASGIRHLGSYLVYQPRKDRFVSASGRRVPVPVTTEAAADVVYQPLEGEEDKHDGTSSVDPGVQTAKLALLSRSTRPGAVAYRYRPASGALFEIRWAQWNGRKWVRQTVYAGSQETEAAIAATVHGDRARIYYAVKPPVCDPGSAETGGLFVAEKAVSAGRPTPSVPWAVRLLDDQAQILRLAAITRADGTDVLYLAAPVIDDPPASRLYFATLPRADDDLDTPAAGVRTVAAVAETNWAYDADVVVSSMLTPQNNGKCVVDGNRVERNSRWISARGDLTPVATLTLDRAVDIDRVEVYSGYFSDPRAIVRAFTVELLVGGEWQPVASVSDNQVNPVVVPVEAPAPTDQVRLVLTDPSGYEGGSDLARIFEIEVYGTEATPS